MENTIHNTHITISSFITKNDTNSTSPVQIVMYNGTTLTLNYQGQENVNEPIVIQIPSTSYVINVNLSYNSSITFQCDNKSLTIPQGTDINLNFLNYSNFHLVGLRELFQHSQFDIMNSLHLAKNLRDFFQASTSITPNTGGLDDADLEQLQRQFGEPVNLNKIIEFDKNNIIKNYIIENFFTIFAISKSNKGDFNKIDNYAVKNIITFLTYEDIVLTGSYEQEDNIIDIIGNNEIEL